MSLVIITGMSGAGKSQALRCFEDMEYFCVDNMPPTLMYTFAEVCQKSRGKFENVALMMDVRGGDMFGELLNELDKLEQANISYEILYLGATNECLVNRYKETRRKHPLATDGNLLAAIQKERKILSAIENRSNNIIDTTGLSPQKFKEKLASMYGSGANTRLLVNIVSFGFKYGLPLDSDLVFDVRFLPNPFYIESLKRHTGLEECVSEYVLQWPQTQEFARKLEEMITYLIPFYIEEGKSQLVVSIGCTGGKHRSVTLAEKLAKHLTERAENVVISHRDIEKDR